MAAARGEDADGVGEDASPLSVVVVCRDACASGLRGAELSVPVPFALRRADAGRAQTTQTHNSDESNTDERLQHL